MMVGIGDASAVDAKRYISVFCQFASGSDTGVTRSPPKFVNTSGATETVTCPAIQDIIDADVEYASITASAKMDEDSCLFLERRQSGGFASWAHTNVTKAGEGYNTTTWAEGSDYINTTTGSVYVIECWLPNNGIILQYRVDDR